MKHYFQLLVLIVLFTTSATRVQAASSFTAEYFNNSSLSGSPVFTQIESAIDHVWGAGSPHSVVNVDQFSARWTATVEFEAGYYVFTTTSDDGVRLIIDGQTVINQWVDQAPTTKQAVINMSASDHTVKLEYYENSGGATATLNWEKASVGSDDSVRVMPLGDSITDGYNVPGGYRIDLKQALPKINFVGSMQNGPAQLTDREHEGHSGWRIDEIQSSIQPWLLSQTPDIILLMIGTNDMIGNYQVATAPQRLSTLIDTITQTLPNANLLVASIIPVSPSEAQLRADIYNQVIPEVIQQKRDLGKKVHYVDMHTAITAFDLSDGRHPNVAGYSKMAQKWTTAIEAVLSDATPEVHEEPTVPGSEGIFTAQYFNNSNLSGAPILTRNEDTVNNNWGSGSPHPSVTTDFFSAKWTTSQVFETGIYEFTVTADDGVRLYIDDQPIINKWIDQGPTTYTANIELSGMKKITLEYYEKSGGAVAEMNWELIGVTNPGETDPEPTLDGEYIAEYFNNTTLSGTPILTRNEVVVNNNWAAGSPHPTVLNDNFSARWTKVADYDEGEYRVSATADDGVRVKVDGEVIIDKWIDQGPTTYKENMQLTQGSHTVVIEYYEKGGGATVKFDIEKISTTPESAPISNGSFNVEYFNTINLASPVVHSEVVSLIEFDWVTGSPHAVVNSDNFSARATKTAEYDEGVYRISVTADDGVKVKLDDEVIINKWIDQGPTTYTAEMLLTQGSHTVVIEYYEKGGGAQLKLIEVAL